MSSNQTAPGQGASQTANLWKEALKVLSDEDQQVIGIQNPDKAEILEKLLAITNEKKQACLKKRWKYRGKDGDVIIRDQLEKVTTWIEKFKDAGNAVVQYDPVHVALPWAGVLFLLQTTLNDSQTFGAMVEGVGLVANTITRYTIMERLYLGPGRRSLVYDQLRENFVKLYVSVLRYLARAKAYFSKVTLKRLLKSSVQPAEAAVHVHLNIIEKKAKSVDVCLDVLKSQCFEATNDKASHLLRLLADLEKPILRSATQISEIHDHLKVNERARILRWLTAVPVSLHHKTIGKYFLPGSCDWLLQLPAFVDFRKSSISSVLWLHGMPGSGKTYLVHHVIDHLLQDSNQNKTAAPVAYFYCARNPAESKRASPDEIMRSILKQLASSGPDKPVKSPVVSLFRDRLMEADMDASDPILPTAAECVPIILNLLEQDPATIVIDAVDECDPNRRHELFSALEQILQESASLVKIFVSSRDAADISDRFSGGPNIYVRAEHNTEDIERFIHHTLENALRTRRLLHGHISKALKSEIIATLKEGAGGMFRWVSLQIDNLCDAQRIKIEEDVRLEVGRLPNTLMESYDVLYQRISNLAPGSRQVAENIFKWLLCAQTLLDAEKLILVVESATQLDSLSISNILDICSFLIVVDDYNVVRFAHLSVREYLEQLPIFSLASCHSLALGRCLAAYSLEYNYHPKASTHLVEKLKPYAMLYWPIHCAKSQAVVDTNLWTAVERFIFDDTRPSIVFEDWISDAWNLSQYSGVVNGDDNLRQKLGATASSSSTPLFLACCFDMTWILEKLLSYGYTNWTAENELSESGIYLAAKWRSHEVLSWLLKKCDPSPEDAAEALVAAIEGNDAKSTDILLQYGVNGYHRTRTGESALHLAVRRKDTRVLDHLLHERSDFYPDTFAEALQIAYEDPTEELFSAMWSRCTELNRSLYLAVLLNLMDEEDHPLVEHILDYASKESELSDIAELDRLGALGWLFVEQDGSEIEFFFNYGDGAAKGTVWDIRSQTERDLAQRSRRFAAPLVISACLKNKVLTKLLIPFCNVDDQDDGWTALAVAISLNQVSICSMLLANGADPNKLSAFEPNNAKEDEMLSPLAIAILHNRPEIATLLITYGADLEDSRDGTTPLLKATVIGHVNMIDLLCMKGANVNAPDKKGRTSLHHAVKNHNHKALDYLCQETDTNLSAKSNKGKTPLMSAVKHRCHHCVDQLLNSGADGNAVDNKGEDAFTYLLYDDKSCQITKKLVEHGAKWNTHTSSGRYPPLQQAVEIENSALAQIFLEAGMDPNYVNWYGEWPLQTAVLKGNKGIVRLLMDHGADPSLKEKYFGTTPVHIAVSTHNLEILQLLLSGKPSVDVQDFRGDTALHIAFRENCPPAFIDVLLSAGASETCPNRAGLTPLEVAIGPSPKLLEQDPFRDQGQDENMYASFLNGEDVDEDGEDLVGLIDIKPLEHPEFPSAAGDEIVLPPLPIPKDSPNRGGKNKSPPNSPTSKMGRGDADAYCTAGRLEPEVDYFNSYGESSWTAVKSNGGMPLRPVDAVFRV